jgi:hypothetical protein
MSNQIGLGLNWHSVDVLFGSNASEGVAKDAEEQRSLAAAEPKLFVGVDDLRVGRDRVGEAVALHLARGNGVVVVLTRVGVR